MAFSIAALAADEATLIQDAEAAAISFPEFYETLTNSQIAQVAPLYGRFS